ncbi:MlaD family protein [Desulforhabdus sp. TSK]|uniref:MlaD family protein n=1 Tax=Desulforhabdus sp. TSK TaxID=2925014 RepID=UPI001FC8D6AD|nr:MlaD family protein [Desulforhabdus sp. TSK]GKT09718.1 hypothetical protein DSTSK_30230 [Desulforhabdus sp. TSK]
MSKKANMTLIGFFVFGAMALLAIVLVVFGSGKFFKDKINVQMYFDGSVKGLSEGATIMFRGVKVGSVTRIQILTLDESQTMTISVLGEIDPENIVRPARKKYSDPRQGLQHLLDMGLKAQLEMQSFVTGQLMIGLDFHPERSANLMGAYPDYTEIPTIPTPLEQIQKTLADIPIKEMVQKLDQIIDGMQKIVNSPETQKLQVELNTTLASFRAVLKNVNDEIKPMATEVKKTTESVRNTFKSMDAGIQSARPALLQAEKTLKLQDGVPGEIAREMKETLAKTQAVLSELQQTASKDSVFGITLQETLREIASTSRSLRELVSYLERHPEALLRGKRQPEGVEE